jgi:hypothetical protein
LPAEGQVSRVQREIRKKLVLLKTTRIGVDLAQTHFPGFMDLVLVALKICCSFSQKEIENLLLYANKVSGAVCQNLLRLNEFTEFWFFQRNEDPNKPLKVLLVLFLSVMIP